jgi:hypothetical protein
VLLQLAIDPGGSETEKKGAKTDRCPLIRPASHVRLALGFVFSARPFAGDNQA